MIVSPLLTKGFLGVKAVDVEHQKQQSIDPYITRCSPGGAGKAWRTSLILCFSVVHSGRPASGKCSVSKFGGTIEMGQADLVLQPWRFISSCH
jgi:hypothetical protein